jgi:hypothetical protein
VYAASVDDEGAFHHHIVNACQAISSCPAFLNRYTNPWWDMSKCAWRTFLLLIIIVLFQLKLTN